MPTVKTDDGRTLVFPEGMSKADMEEALKALPPAASRHGTSGGWGDSGSSPEPSRGEMAAIGANAGARALPMGDEATTGLGALKGILGTAYHVGKAIGVVKENPDFEDFISTKDDPTGREFVGKTGEQALEFMGGDAAAAKGVELAAKIPKVGKAIEAAPAMMKWFGRGARRFGSGYGITRAEGGTPDEAMTAGAVNAGLPAVLEALGGAGKAIGTKILNSAIRPTQTDLKDGYKVETILREGLDTGNLEKLHESVVAKKEALKQAAKAIRAKAAAAGGDVDVLEAFTKAHDELLADPRNIGKYDAIERAYERHVNDLGKLTQNGRMDVIDANDVKTGLGFNGEWAHGSAVTDAQADSLFATKAYKHLNSAITTEVGNFGPRLKMINQRLSDLIPIEKAVARRLPIEARNNPLGLFKAIALTSGHYGLFLADVAQRSTRAGGALVRSGTMMRPGAGLAGAAAAAATRNDENEDETRAQY